jgi:hypothetical protein
MAAAITEFAPPTEPELDVTPPERATPDLSRRRFIVAVVVGTAVTLPLFLWLLWGLWSGSPNVLRGVPYDYFYDLQARGMFHGHLWLPNGKMGIEAFVHDGHDYTYFGLFPSILRMPILLVTDRLDGQMTAPSLLLAWLLTSVASALMIWKLRFLIRGNAMVSRLEAAAYGTLIATIMGGSVVLYLGATPFVYSEDFAWSIPLTVGSLFALLSVMESPSWRRVLASGVLILCTTLNRSPPGWACCIAAMAIAGWFALGKGGAANKRWTLPLLAVGVVPFLIGCVVTYLKFGIPVGLPMADQVWAHVNAHRRYFLAANGGKAFNFAFLPSTLTAYFQPAGMRVSGLFPFIAPPGAPALWLAGAVMDQSYPTASFTDTSPLLLLLGAWGAVTALRPRGFGRVRLTRIVVVGAALGAAGVLLWGYMSQRYLADLMPFFIIAGGIGLIDVWRRLEARTKRARGVALGAIVALGVYCIAANLAIASFPVSQWTPAQSARFISAENSLSFDSLSASVQHGSTLPDWAPAGQIFIAGGCSGLYLSTGNDLKDVPGQRIEHYTWMPVEESPSFVHIIGFTFNGPVSQFHDPVTLMTYGHSRLVMEPVPDVPGYVQLHLYDSGTKISWPSPIGWKFPIDSTEVHHQLQIVVTIDPNLNRFLVGWYNDQVMINHYVAGRGPVVVHQTPRLSSGSPSPMVTVADVPLRDSAEYSSMRTGQFQLSLCRSLNQGR